MAGQALFGVPRARPPLACWLAIVACWLLLASPGLASDKASIKQNVDDVVKAIDNGRPATSFAADAFVPYVFVMEPSGRLLVHPYLVGEYLQEKAAPVHAALQQATTDGLWVSYFWKGTEKETYVRRTQTNLTVGSGQ